MTLGIIILVFLILLGIGFIIYASEGNHDMFSGAINCLIGLIMFLLAAALGLGLTLGHIHKDPPSAHTNQYN
jgi:arginine exporter protein ArgO